MELEVHLGDKITIFCPPDRFDTLIYLVSHALCDSLSSFSVSPSYLQSSPIPLSHTLHFPSLTAFHHILPFTSPLSYPFHHILPFISPLSSSLYSSLSFIQPTEEQLTQCNASAVPVDYRSTGLPTHIDAGSCSGGVFPSFDIDILSTSEFLATSVPFKDGGKYYFTSMSNFIKQVILHNVFPSLPPSSLSIHPSYTHPHPLSSSLPPVLLPSLPPPLPSPSLPPSRPTPFPPLPPSPTSPTRLHRWNSEQLCSGAHIWWRLPQGSLTHILRDWYVAQRRGGMGLGMGV